MGEALIVRKGGGGTKEWRLIRSITITENVKTITIDVDDEGNPFEITQFLLNTNATNRKATSSTSTTLVINPNGKEWLFKSYAVLRLVCGAPDAVGRAWLYAHAMNPPLIFVSPWFVTNTDHNAAKTVAVAPLEENPFAIGEVITSFTISGEGNSHYIGAGSTIEIYGR